MKKNFPILTSLAAASVALLAGPAFAAMPTKAPTAKHETKTAKNAAKTARHAAKADAKKAAAPAAK